MKHRLEFSASKSVRRRVTVGVNITNNYDRDLATYIELDKTLRAKIPFEFTVAEGPKVEILAGDTHRGKAQIVMVIGHEMDDAAAIEKLEVAGFTPFVWPSFC